MSLSSNSSSSSGNGNSIQYLNESLVQFLSPNNERIVRILSLSIRSVVALVSDSNGNESVIKVGSGSKTLKREVECLSELTHPNIVNLNETYSIDDLCFLRLERILAPNLTEILNKGPIAEDKAIRILIQLVKALNFLHSHNWVHRDIKPDNILYDQQTEKVTLIDFEYASKFYQGINLERKVGTTAYMSPEVNVRCYQGPEADVWSLGVTFYAILTGRLPFSSQDSEYCLEFPVTPSLRPSTKQLVKQMLALPSEKRITIIDLLNTLEKKSKSSNHFLHFHESTVFKKMKKKKSITLKPKSNRDWNNGKNGNTDLEEVEVKVKSKKTPSFGDKRRNSLEPITISIVPKEKEEFGTLRSSLKKLSPRLHFTRKSNEIEINN